MVDGSSSAERQDRRSVLDAGIFLRRHHLDQKADRFPRLFAQPVAALKKVECALKALARARKIRSHDWSTKYGPIVEAAASLPVTSAILDGEVIVLKGGVSDFGALRSAIRRQPDRLIFVGFDLLHLDGKDLRHRPLVERRTMLANLIAGMGPAHDCSK